MDFAETDGGEGDDAHVERVENAPPLDESVPCRAAHEQQQRQEGHEDEAAPNGGEPRANAATRGLHRGTCDRTTTALGANQPGAPGGAQRGTRSSVSLRRAPLWSSITNDTVVAGGPRRR